LNASRADPRRPETIRSDPANSSEDVPEITSKCREHRCAMRTASGSNPPGKEFEGLQLFGPKIAAQASVVCAPRFSRLPLLVHFFLYMIFRRYVESAPPPFWIWLTHPRVLPFLEHCEAGGSLAN
jgi:hypothetical protein